MITTLVHHTVPFFQFNEDEVELIKKGSNSGEELDDFIYKTIAK
tara:strand:+ start:603 stop:734 length:132 start_codon:yes stop_codon:yes gene_type:complete